MSKLTLSRRTFVVGASTAGAGLAISILSGCGGSSSDKPATSVPDTPTRSPSPTRTRSTRFDNPEVNAWVHVGVDDVVTIRIARSEMGQGTLTGLAQLVAEELECDWSKVVTEYPTPGENLKRDRVWGSFATGGSQGIRGSYEYVLEGGAAARMMLIEAAANAWGVPVGECTAANSTITHNPSGQTVTFGAVADEAAKVAPPIDIKLKKQSEWKIVGQPVLRLDSEDKITGKQKFGADLYFDGMLNASILACPIRNGKLKKFNANKVKDMPGVKYVIKVDDTSVAVVAETWWQANKALSELPVEWEGGDKFSSTEFEKELDEGLAADQAFPGNGAGDLKKAFEEAERLVVSSYNMPFQNHAPMEPMNATAIWHKSRAGESCEVWCPTQNGEAAHAALVATSGLKTEQCEVHKVHLGGGFGRRGMSDYVSQVVNIVRQIPNTHIKLLWSREEDMRQGYFHPITKARLQGTLNGRGHLTGIKMRISGQSILSALMPQALINGIDFATFQGLLPSGIDPRVEDQTLKYDFPAFLFDHAMRNPPVRPGFWRGVNANQNAIYLECFMDELAKAAGRDPLEFRLAHLKKSPKLAAVLRAVAKESGWGKRDGLSRGLCCFYSFGSYTAACAEVTVDRSGQLKMHRIVAATDCGTAVNPQQIEAQIQGSFVYGLSAMLYGENTFENGEVQEENFNTFNSMRIADMPKVKTILMPSGGFWGGVGEPTIAVAAPAVMNGIYAATGIPVRKLPIKGRNLRKA